MASDQILSFLDFLQRELLLFASLCFLIGAVDDLLFDGLWIFHRMKRRLFVYSRYQRATVESLSYRIRMPHGDICTGLARGIRDRSNAAALFAAMVRERISHLCRLLPE